MTPANVKLLLQMIWSALMLGTCAYVVFGLGHSGWWFALAFLFCMAVAE